MNQKFKYILVFSSSFLISFLLVNAQTSPENLFNIDANAVALWRFNEPSGSLVADETGINNGTTIGATIVDGKFGKARSYNGISDYIVFPDNPSLNSLSQITIEAWVYPTGFDLGCWANAEDIVSKGVDSNQGYVNGYNLRIGRNQEGWCAGASSFNQVNFSASIKGVGVSSPLWYMPNQPPTISNLNQYKSDGITLITENSTTTESTVVFKASLNDFDNNQIKLQNYKETEQTLPGLVIIKLITQSGKLNFEF